MSITAPAPDPFEDNYGKTEEVADFVEENQDSFQSPSTNGHRENSEEVVDQFDLNRDSQEDNAPKSSY